MNQTLIHHFLERSAKKYPDKIALIHENLRITYKQINGEANQLASLLREQGIEKDDRVALMFENCLEYIVSYYGALKIGAIVTPLSSDLKPDGLTSLLERLHPAAIISSSRFERVLKAGIPTHLNLRALVIHEPKLDWNDSPFPVISWLDHTGDKASSNPNTPIEASDTASIILTSGSTGKQKGVMLSHRNIVTNTHSIVEYLELTCKDIQMCILPFFYVMGKSLLNTHFAVGGTIVINNNFAFPASVLQQMVKEQVTGFSGVPSTYSYLLHRSPFEKYRDKFKTLRYCSQAGGHMSRQLKIKLRQALPEHTKIFIMYGASEASARLTYLEPGHFIDKIDSIGKPVKGVSIQILDTEGRAVPNYQRGELVAKGPNIMQGYWNDEDATARVLDQNGYHTGDIGFQDDDGFFYIEGRKDHLLKVGGHRVSPTEIENALMETKSLVEVQVLGVSDELMGHALVAIGVPINKECIETDILKFCSDKLPKHKIPSRIKLIRTLPKNANGKIDRAKCMDLIRQ